MVLFQGKTQVNKRLQKNIIQQLYSEIILSNQIISEISINLLRKANYSEKDLRNLVSQFYQDYPIITLIEVHYKQASDLRESYQFSFWDSLIVAVALQNQCEIL